MLSKVFHQPISEMSAINRTYRYSIGDTISPSMALTNDTLEVDLPEEDAGKIVTVTVRFQDGACNSMASISDTGKVSS